MAGSAGGIISVNAGNACGLSTLQTFTVIPATPATPGIINGPSSICSGSTNTYQVAAVNGATSYTWTFPNGWTGSSFTEIISANANTNGGDVLVTANNACGSSAAQTLSITIETVPATPGSINGPNLTCSGSANLYSVASVNGATGYTWTLPSGWSGSSGTESINPDCAIENSHQF